MQRRAAAVLIGLFLLAAVGAYALVATATAPQVTIDDPAVELTNGETATIGGQAYTLAAVEDAGATLASTVADARTPTRGPPTGRSPWARRRTRSASTVRWHG